MTYEDVVAGLEMELGCGIVSMQLTDTAVILECEICGERYATRPMLRISSTVFHYICPDRIACSVRYGHMHQAVADAVTLLPAPEDAQSDDDIACESSCEVKYEAGCLTNCQTSDVTADGDAQCHGHHAQQPSAAVDPPPSMGTSDREDSDADA